MKKVIVLLVVMVAVNIIHSQVQSDCTVPPELISYYNWDIKQLAIYRMFQISSPDTALVRIPQGYIDSIAEGMAGIIHASSIPESDSVFNLYCVHNYFGWPGGYDGYLVKIDTSYSWTDAWQNLLTMTGDPLMDTIIVRYSLYIEHFYTWSIGCVALINSDSIWNLYALCDSLEMVPGVIYAEKNGLMGDGAYIGYNIISDERYYEFSYEWGDCFAGCACYYRWKFKVNSDCQVTYLGLENNIGEYCPELPDPSNCDLFSSIEGQFFENNTFIFPNPSKDKITISSSSITANTKLSIFNVSGEKVIEKQLRDNEALIDISALPRGVYFVRVQSEKMVEVEKMVKE